jgi:hypothetical protein
MVVKIIALPNLLGLQRLIVSVGSFFKTLDY